MLSSLINAIKAYAYGSAEARPAQKVVAGRFGRVEVLFASVEGIAWGDLVGFVGGWMGEGLGLGLMGFWEVSFFFRFFGGDLFADGGVFL